LFPDIVVTALRSSPRRTCAEKRKTVGQRLRPLATKREGPPCSRPHEMCASPACSVRAGTCLETSPPVGRGSTRRDALATLALPCCRSADLRCPVPGRSSLQTDRSHGTHTSSHASTQCAAKARCAQQRRHRADQHITRSTSLMSLVGRAPKLLPIHSVSPPGHRSFWIDFPQTHRG